MKYYQVVESWTEMTKEKLLESLDNVRKAITDGLDMSFENPGVFEKYNWLKYQYERLIILSDFDSESKTHQNVKFKIHELNEGLYGQNIHYSYTDKAYELMRKRENRGD